MTRSLKGTRWEDSDARQGDRVIRILEDPLAGVTVTTDGEPEPTDDWLDRDVRYEVETAQYNPSTIGDKGRLKVRTLQERYRKISR